MHYEEKLSNLIKLCNEAKSRAAEFVIIDHPQVLGDTYEEIIESLNQIADADLKLLILPTMSRHAAADAS
jgi:Mrp family chromosome partitioning ATPase